MSEQRRGLESDYRDERWASRIEYVADHLGDWLFAGFLCIVGLFLVIVYVAQSIILWGMGMGWATILAFGVPLLWGGWLFLRRWSRKTLNKAYRRRLEDGKENREQEYPLRVPVYDEWRFNDERY